MDGLDISSLLPPSLLLPPRLSAHKYLMVCTLTVAAWDTLVLSPRTWRLYKTQGWPLLKITYQFLRYLMPVEFAIVAVAFFDSSWSLERCQHFYLFEPIVTAFLMAIASLSLAVRMYAIWDKSKIVMFTLGPLLFLQVVVQAICCAFYQVVPLDVGQGCIAGPKHNWVGIYWLAPTIFYTATLIFAIARSRKSQLVKPMNLWKLFLRDGLNLYGAIWLVNMINVLFWLIVTPNGPEDTIKTIITSMTAVLTTTMTLRVILGIRGQLNNGGTYSGMSSSSQPSHSNPVSSGARKGPTASEGPVPAGARHSLSQNIRSNPGGGQTYTIEEMRAKTQREWAAAEHEEEDGKSGYALGEDDVVDHDSLNDRRRGEKAAPLGEDDRDAASVKGKNPGGIGVKVTIDREFQ
ncbi:hypothetical protein FS837_004473 [Tulasnella sp. UAMH 9824]|nr:hypothetical protein FS837_004473 [Tulasnella sp. UAMH 9824]